MRDAFRSFDLAGAVSFRPRTVDDHVHFRSDILIAVWDKNGVLRSTSFQHNLRTNAGADFWNNQLFGASPGAAARFMGMTTDATPSAAGDTFLTAEETTNGLARTSALTAAHTSGTGQSVFTNVFTYTGASPKVIAKLGLFTAVGPPVAGTLALETLLASTATVNANGDQLSVTWTISY